MDNQYKLAETEEHTPTLLKKRQRPTQDKSFGSFAKTAEL
jgi:hypothetical protein